MIFTGKYNIKKNNSTIVAYNNIQKDGFELMQSWFLTKENNSSKKIDLINNSTVQATGFISSGGDLLEPIKESSSNYIQVNQKTATYTIEFNDIAEIYAIGIDCDYFIEDNSLTSLIKVEYQKDTGLQYMKIDDLLIPAFIREQIEVDDRLENEKIYYLNSLIKAKSIRFTFGGFLASSYTSFIPYFLYRLRLYSKTSNVYPPTHISLYNQEATSENIDTLTPLLRKEISYVLADSSLNYSVIFKTNLELDDLNSSDNVYAIALDYKNENDEFVHFSLANFDTPWQQEAFETVEIQYQLSMSNN